jgi:anti-anti-sigma factor
MTSHDKVRMDREREVGAAFVGLADTLGDDFDVIDLFDRLAAHVVSLTGAAAVGVMMSDGNGRLRTIAASSQRAALLEALQVQAGQGPCVRCYETGRSVHVPDLAAPGHRWPKLAPAAARAGYRAMHTVPLRLRSSALGAVNLFYARPGPAPYGDMSLAQALADVAAVAMLHEPTAGHRPEDLLGRLQAAMTNKTTIEQAKGMLAVRGELSIEDAALALRMHARSSHLPITGVARALVRRDLLPEFVLATWRLSAPAAKMPAALGSAHSIAFCCRVVDFREDRVVLEAMGELDLSSADDMAAVLAPHLNSGTMVLVNMAAVNFIDLRGLRVLQNAYARESKLCVVAPNSAVTRLLDLIDSPLPHFDTIEQALGMQAG